MTFVHVPSSYHDQRLLSMDPSCNHVCVCRGAFCPCDCVMFCRFCCSVRFCSVCVIVICPILFFCPILFCHSAVLSDSVLSVVFCLYEWFCSVRVIVSDSVWFCSVCGVLFCPCEWVCSVRVIEFCCVLSDSAYSILSVGALFCPWCSFLSVVLCAVPLFCGGKSECWSLWSYVF